MENLNIITAFIGGIVTFFSPCIIPLLPLYLSFLSGTSINEIKANTDPKTVRNKVFIGALFFCIGFTISFTIIGLTASTLAHFIFDYKSWAIQVAGVIIMIFGLHTTGLLKIKFFYKEKKIQYNPKKTKSIAGIGFFLGFTIVFGWIPCITPVLAVILTLGANNTTLTEGFLLLPFFAIGFLIPFMLIVVFFRPFLNKISSFSKTAYIMNIVVGGVMIIIGALLFFNQLILLTVGFEYLVDFISFWN